MKPASRIVALVFALVMALALAACGGNAGSSTSPSTAAGELMGKPWVTSVLAGNLPTEQPETKDDLYTHYNYEYLAAHQSKPSSTMDEHSSELKDATVAIVKDESKAGHDLEQLRIFYKQAVDSEALQAAGLSEIQPYLDRIEAVKSIDEMNALITADDFPFSPFILANVSTIDTRATNVVSVNPNFVLSDALFYGGMYYQDSSDSQVQKNREILLQYAMTYPLFDLISAGMTTDETKDAGNKILAFEKAHGKHLDSSETYLKADYGAMAEAASKSHFTLEEMCELASNFPLKATLDKLGKGGSETYVSTKEWLEAFNGLWTEDNLDAIKLVARAKVLGETRPYRDPSIMNTLLEQSGMAVPSSDDFAYEACASIDTLGNVVAKTYNENVLGPDAKARLTTLSQDLINTYKYLIDNTPWMGEESQQRVIEKLDHITLNVLEPTGGFFDYSELELTPTDQGGTLFSNYLKLKQYRQDCESKLIGQPATASFTWYAVSPTVKNALYDAMSNSINICPGFVSSLIYHDGMSDNDLLASAGWTIGHEISHSFDYTGSQLDAYGTPNPVFTDADVDAFVLKCSTLALYYKGIEIMPGQMVDGELVVGEAAADLCGMQACLELASKINGFDYDKYFDSVSNMWAQVESQATLQQQTLDTHPLNNLRINVNSQMFDVIYDVFGVAEGDGMYLAPNERIVIWGPNA